METKLICRECAADLGRIPADNEGEAIEEPRREDFETFAQMEERRRRVLDLLGVRGGPSPTVRKQAFGGLGHRPLQGVVYRRE